MHKFSEKLAKYDIKIASNQFEYSLINQDRADDGTLAECKKMGKDSLLCCEVGNSRDFFIPGLVVNLSPSLFFCPVWYSFCFFDAFS